MNSKKTSLNQDVNKAYQAIKKNNIFGILSIVAAFASLFTAGMAATIGVILGIIGLIKKEKKILCITGIILSFLFPMIYGILMLVLRLGVAG